MLNLLFTTSSIHWIDYIIVIASLLLAIGVGIYFSHHQKDSATFFTASGKVPDWAIGMSIFATLISSVTFLAYPGAAYSGNWILLVQGLMVQKSNTTLYIRILRETLWSICPFLLKHSIHTDTFHKNGVGILPRLYGSCLFYGY